MQFLVDKSSLVRVDGDLGDDANMFDMAPVSLWLEDYSEVKILLDEWRRAGVADLRAYLNEHPARIKDCADRIRVVKVNRRTLSLFEVDDLPDLIANLGQIFRDEMLVNLVDEIAQLWDGKVGFESNGVNYSLSGRRIDIQLKGSLLPGHETDWARVLIAVEDVSEREGARRLLALSENYARGLSSTRRFRFGSRTSAASNDCSMKCATRGSTISGCLPMCIRNLCIAA